MKMIAIALASALFAVALPAGAKAARHDEARCKQVRQQHPITKCARNTNAFCLEQNAKSRDARARAGCTKERD